MDVGFVSFLCFFLIPIFGWLRSALPSCRWVCCCAYFFFCRLSYCYLSMQHYLSWVSSFSYHVCHESCPLYAGYNNTLACCLPCTILYSYFTTGFLFYFFIFLSSCVSFADLYWHEEGDSISVLLLLSVLNRIFWNFFLWLVLDFRYKTELNIFVDSLGVKTYLLIVESSRLECCIWDELW